jgi:oxygen-dependent protoporphyrinogen oxidase
MLAAYALDKRGYCVTLIEERERGGGLINTRKTEHGIAESAAHSLIATRAVRELCAELNVELIEPRKESKAKFIMRGGRLRRFPLGVREAAGAFRRAAFVRADDGSAQNLEAWARRHLGGPALNYLLTPFVRGIYGVQPAQLGVAAAYPGLSVPPGKTLLGALLNKRRDKAATEDSKQRVAPQLGMGELVSGLERRLSQKLGSRFRRNESVREIPDAANVIIATPAYAAAKLLRPVAPALSAKLNSVNYTPIVSVTVFVERGAFSRPVHGTGVLMPACEERKSLGILFNSSSFDYRVSDDARFASFTVMMGGTAQPEWLEADDDEILQAIKLELSDVLGIREPLAGIIHRWPAALPQYSPELPGVWQHARESWCATPGRMLFGN